MERKEMRELAEMVAEKVATRTKGVLTLEETAKYLGVSKSHLYRLTMERRIPYYKTNGKMCYFDRTELETWLKRNRVETTATIESNAICETIRRGA